MFLRVFKYFLVLNILFFFSCSTVKESYKSDMEVSYKKILFMEKNSAVILNITDNNGKERVEIESPLIPGVIISGQLSRETDGIYCYITDVRMFSNWENGWTEGFFEASGKYLFVKDDSSYVIKEVDPFELWDIVSGEIRYYDAYYREDDGLWKVKNRTDRLMELSRVLHKDFNLDSFYGHIEKKNSIGKAFTKDVYPVLFPELYDFKKLDKSGKLPIDFYKSVYKNEIVWGNGIKWRTDYTKSVFQEQLWDLRDSGTLYRDVIEAPEIFFSLYNLESFFEEVLLKEEYISNKE